MVMLNRIFYMRRIWLHRNYGRLFKSQQLLLLTCSEVSGCGPCGQCVIIVRHIQTVNASI